MHTETHRKILAWYVRFDLFAGLMSGYETVLGQEWFRANEQYFSEQSKQYPEDTDYQIELAIASHRLMSVDMALLFARLPRGEISMQQFLLENELLRSQIASWEQSFAPLLESSDYLVTSFEGAQAGDPADIVDPYRPGGLYSGPLWSLNYLRMDTCGIKLMRAYQTAMMMRQPIPPELESLALEMCRIFEAIEFWPSSSEGSLLAAQASLGIATLFLPNDEKHIMWCRRKLAVVEGMGYATFRSTNSQSLSWINTSS